MKRPLKVPRKVVLPVSHVVSCGLMRAALANASRQLINTWQKKYGFPASYKDGRNRFYLTADISAWLIEHGSTVETENNDR